MRRQGVNGANRAAGRDIRSLRAYRRVAVVSSGICTYTTKRRNAMETV